MLIQFEQQVESTITKYNMLNYGDTVVVGVSGGADSMALLHTLSKFSQKYNLNIICAHLNHGIRGDEAQRDSAYVQTYCKEHNIQCYCDKADIPQIAKNEHISEELAGRQQRYNLFNKLLAEYGGGKIAVAHNKNDSVETVLIKLTRGCSLNGLRGIAPVNGNIIRPLIETERADIEQYLNDCDIQYMTDSTNSENIYTRNIIRNKVIPVLQTINPGFINTVYNNSTTLCDDDDYLDICSKEHAKSCVAEINSDVCIDINYFKDLHISVKKRIILYAVDKLNGSKTNIEQKHINILCRNHETGNIYNIGAGITAYVEYDKLILTRKVNFNNNDEYEIKVDVGNTYNISNKCIKFELTDNTDISDKSCMYISLDNMSNKTIILRNRRNGDRFSPSGMSGTKKLKDFFIDNKIPQSVRNTTPLLCIDNEIAAVIGYRVSSKFVIDNKTKKILKISILGGTNE